MNRKSFLKFRDVTALVVALHLAGFAVAEDRKAGEWPSYAADKASTKYSPLDQIDKSNVGKLEIAWRWKSIDYEMKKKNPKIRTSNIFESTPIMVGGTLYTKTGARLAAAIEPTTGETLWVYNPFGEGEDARAPARAGFPVARGLAYWSGGGDERLFLSSDEYLVALDPKTGALVESFGDGGRVDMKKGLDKTPPYYFWTSPPLICNDVIVMGNSTLDQQITKEGTPGHVRGYDARTGEMLWIFRVIPRPGEFGYDTWEEGSASYTGHGNVWTWMSADEELGYVYLPTSTPNNDWYGGHRKGDGLFAESLVCLDAKTGQRVWHFQMIHHGVWDYDLPCAPILCDITVNGKKIKAVAQVSKQAFCYVFDRVTGEPVWPIEERPVPQTTAPGEKTSPTQPHPTKPPAFDRQGVTEDDLIDFTPELRAEAIEIVNQYVHGPIFTPPSIMGTEPGDTKGTIQMPGPVGGANWNGAAFDPETQTLYVPSVSWPMNAALVQPAGGRSNLNYVRGGMGFIPGPRGLPLFKPPYGRITAIDLNKGEHKWMVPNGEGPRDHPALKDLGLPRLGQPGRASILATKTLLFIGEGSKGMIAVPPGGGGKMFRAYDKTNGDVVWEMELDAGTTAAPMSYMAGGKQYILVAIAEGKYEGEFIALTLPD